ncbi:MAG: energy-coupling factor ABC transporter ATP-binding protein [Halobacteriota archaeon]
MTTSAVEFKNAVFRYPNGAVALDGITLRVEEHAKVVLLGENGSGKTTLLLHLNGLHTPTSGEVMILGRPVNRANIDWARTKVGMIFQNPDDQLFAPTVFQDVAFGPRNLGMDETRVRERVEETLDVLNIAHLRERPPDALSGGEKRRVALAGILVMDAEILVLDEPHSGLDPSGYLELNDLLDELHAKGCTILIATHDVEFAASWADEVVILKNGIVLAQGSPSDVFSNPDKLAEANLKPPAVVSIYNELKSRSFVHRGDKTPLDIMDLVSKIESPTIKFMTSSGALTEGMRLGLEYVDESWIITQANEANSRVLTYNEDVAVIELLDGTTHTYGDIIIFKVHDDERYDQVVAKRAMTEIALRSDGSRLIKVGAMGTNAKLLAKHHDIPFDFGVDVINKSISYAARGYNVILLASGKMAEHAGKKIYGIRPDIFFHYINVKDESLPEAKNTDAALETQTDGT